MQTRIPRREFLGGVAAFAAASAVPFSVLHARDMLYPPMDLSHFDTPITPAPSEIHFGYAAITWGGNDRQAIEDIAAVGFHGIQLRSNVVEEFDNKPDALLALLAKHGLTMFAVSSGGLSVDRKESDELAKHERNAQFLRDAGGKYLQVT